MAAKLKAHVNDPEAAKKEADKLHEITSKYNMSEEDKKKLVDWKNMH